MAVEAAVEAADFLHLILCHVRVKEVTEGLMAVEEAAAVQPMVRKRQLEAMAD